MGDPSKDKGLNDFTRILDEFLNQCERASIKSQHHNDSNVRKHNLAHEPHNKSKSASLKSEISKLEQTSSDTHGARTKKMHQPLDIPSASCSDTERKHQKKSFFHRARDRLLRTFYRQSTARKATSKQSSKERKKKSANKRLVQDKTVDQKDGYDRKLCAGQEIRKETLLSPATEELNLHQITSKSTKNPELGGGEQTETQHDRYKREPAHFSSGEKNEECISYHQIPQVLHGGQALALISAQTRVHISMKTVLDEPSEDIRFIDDDDDDNDDDKKVGQKNSYGDQSAQHRITPKLHLLAGGSRLLAITANVERSGENTGPQTLPQEERGSALRAGSGTRLSPHHQLQKQFSLEIDGDDMHDGKEDTAEGEATPPLNSTEKNKDEEISKIAGKIITMAEQYVESTRAAQKEDFLEDLERQLVEWVRTTGDSYATTMDRQAETFIQQLTEKTYKDFKRIICDSLGKEITSNHLVILFYTVKGTLSLIGRSSTFVSRLMQFASRYYMEEIHGWLTQRGGFQSLLDQTESLVD